MKISQDLFNLYEEFEDEFSDEKRFPRAGFWNSYLSMIQILRNYAKSIKTGDWDLHMFASEKMLYWFHAYDHFNYARHTFPITGQHSKFSQLSTLVHIKTSKMDTLLLGAAKRGSTRFHQTRSWSRESTRIKRSQLKCTYVFSIFF